MRTAQPKMMTVEEFLELPDDGVDRELILGELRERPMTRRNPEHSEVMVTIGRLLGNWAQAQDRPRGRVCGGEAGFRLRRGPETFVGIDIAYVSPEQVAARDRKLKFYDGPPVLAVEILSPSDQIGDVVEKVELYGEVGTIVWVVNPYFETVAIHRPGQKVETMNTDQEIAGEPYLPGFRAKVAEFFD